MKTTVITSCLEKIEYFDTVFGNTSTEKKAVSNNLINKTDLVKMYSHNGELHLIIKDNNFNLSELKLSMKEEANRPLLLQRI